ncbi:Fanconi anemia group M protein [Neosynchiropus ocellatus]
MSSGSNQRTLFQTWGSSAPQNKTSAPLPGAKKATAKRKGTVNNPTQVPAAAPVPKPLWPEIGQQSRLTSDDPGEGNQLGEDDDLMLVAVYEAEKKLQDEETETVAPSAPAGKAFPHLAGFDTSAADVWIYPTNYPVRDYQLKISEAALFQNTLVCLPTGLGKTFVASVVMYNFYRWYPSAKIVFMAPTKPLVAQQIEACFHVMGIPQVHMAELTGTTAAKQRQEQWKSKRVFFLTPQVMVNDLARDTCPAQQVKCLVIDEAHKALGNHAYCQVIRQLASQTQQFRVLALSATPGSDVKAIQSVISNLLISHLELRSEESSDLQAYSHQRSVEKMVVPLGETLTAYQNLYLQILEKFTSRLVQNRAMSHKDLRNLTKYQMILARDQFRKNPPSHIQAGPHTGPQLGVLEGDFALCISLCHGYELLLQTGLRSFFLYLQGIMDGSREMSRARNELQRTPMFLSLYQEMEAMFTKPTANTDTGIFSPGPGPAEPFVYSHPKLEKLQEVVLQHFKDANASEAAAGSSLQRTGSRVMIFSSFRDSVQEIATMLNRHSPLIKVMTFMGQSSTGKGVKGFTQKEQLEVIQKFRQGDFNTLVSTCVGEEGLDIGEVDLIICFDAQKSPIRLVQRMGRTGRQRHGRIVVILTEGREERTYNTSQSNRRSVIKSIVNRSGLHMYPSSPRMLPEGLRPLLHKMYITSGQFVQRISSVSRRSSRGRRSHSEGQSSLIHPRNLVDVDTPLYGLSTSEYSDYTATMRLGEQDAQPTLETSHFLSLPQEPSTQVPSRGPSRVLSLWEWRHWQSRLLPTHQVDHSLRCQHFVQLMALIDTMKYESEDECLYEQQLLPHLGKRPDQHVTRKRRKTSKQPTPAPNQEVHVGSPHEAGTFSSRLQTHDQMVTSVPEAACPGFEEEVTEMGLLDEQEELERLPRSQEDLDADRTLKVILANVAELLSRSPPPLPLDMDVFMEAVKPGTPVPFKVSFTLDLDDDDDGEDEGPMDKELQGHRDLQPQAASKGSNEAKSPTWEDVFEDGDGGFQDPDEEVLMNHGEAEADSWTRVKHGDVSEEKVDPALADDHSLDLFEDDEAFLQMTIPDVQTPRDSSKPTENPTTSPSWAVQSDHHGTQLPTTVSGVHSDKRIPEAPKSADRSSWDHFPVNFDLGFSLDSDEEEEPPTSTSPAPHGALESSKPQTTAVHCSTPQNLLRTLSRQVNFPTPQSAAERRTRGRTSPQASPLTCRGAAKTTEVTGEPPPARPDEMTPSKSRPDVKFVPDFTLQLGVDSDSEEEVVVTKRRRQHNALFSPDRTNISATDSPLLASRKRSKPLDTSEQAEDDDDFQSQHVFRLPACGRNGRRPAPARTKPRAPNAARHFLDQEAELSEDEQVSSDEDDGDDQNCSLDGFVVNNTHLSQGLNESEMRGVYLQSVKSPAPRGKFKMSYRHLRDMDVFSQVPEQDETYAEDSFVVGSEEEEEEEQSDAAYEDVVELMPEDSYVDGRRQYATRRRVLQRRVQARDPDVAKPTRTKKSRVIRLVDSSEEEAEGGGVREEPSSSSSASKKQYLENVQVNSRCCQRVDPQNQLDLTGCHNQQPLKNTGPDLPGPLRILVDSRCIGGGVELITRLRQQHGITVHVCSLDGRHFIVSNRTAVERHVESNIAAMQNRKTLSERVTGLMGKFERVCLIVEKDRAKPGETSRPFQRSRYYDSTVVALVASGVRLLWSSGAEESADLLAELGRLEQRKGHGINVNPEVKGQRQLALQFCRTLPSVNRVQALNMTRHFPSMAALAHSSVESLRREASLSRSRAEELLRFLRHPCDTFVLNSLRSGKSY